MLVDDPLRVLDIVLVQLAARHGVGLGELFGHRLEELGQEAVVGGLGHGVVEGGVELLALLGVLEVEPLPHVRQHGFDLVELFEGGPLRGQARRGGFEDPAHLEHVQEGVALHREEHGQGADDVVGLGAADEGALARADVDDAEHLQRPDGLAHGGPADLESVREIPLGEQLVAGLQLPLGDEVLDLVHDLFVEPFGLDGGEFHTLNILSCEKRMRCKM